MPGKHDQSTHGRGKGGVRQSLARAKTTEDVATALSGEAKTITGHDIEADFSGADVQLAREHSEGILRGLERYPNTQLGKVSTYGPGSRHELGREDQVKDDIAVTEPHGGPGRTHPNGKRGLTDAIYFNNAYSGTSADTEAYRSNLQEMHKSRFGKPSKPQHVAIHELGHVFSTYGGSGEPAHDAYQHVWRQSQQPGSKPISVLIKGQISHYAAYNRDEMSAEVFSDVLINGSRASALSKSTFKILEDHHNAYLAKVGIG